MCRASQSSLSSTNKPISEAPLTLEQMCNLVSSFNPSATHRDILPLQHRRRSHPGSPIMIKPEEVRDRIRALPKGYCYGISSFVHNSICTIQKLTFNSIIKYLLGYNNLTSYKIYPTSER
jgi:hypothetical protein